jgi:hypothetical protein
VTGPKVKAWRSEPYRRYVASGACFGCGIEGYSQCAHGNTGKGRGIKVSDERSFPLCGPRFGLIGCHQQFDLCIDMTRDERRETEVGYIERQQTKARADGWTFLGASGREAPMVEEQPAPDVAEAA